MPESVDFNYSVIGEPVVYIPTLTWGYIGDVEVCGNEVIYSLALADGSFEGCVAKQIFPDTVHKRLGKYSNKDVENILEVIKWHKKIREEACVNE